MAKASMQLDPNAAAYSNDEIVGKINAATATITRVNALDEAALPIESTTFKKYSEAEQTKLTGIEAGATVDQTGSEIQTAILGLSDADRLLIKTDPTTGEYPVLAIQRDAAGKLDIDYDTVPKG